MKKKAQTLIISLWIMAILTILAVGIGHRVASALRLSRYSKDKFKAFCLAKAGVSRAIAEIENNSKNAYYSLNQPWSNNEKVFKKITFDTSDTDFATVSFNILDINNNPQTVYGARDEERKININTAPQELLDTLIKTKGIANSLEIANNICAWRGVGGVVDDAYYKALGYSNKGYLFTNIEELLLVKDVKQEIYDKLKDSITVYGDGKININTVPSDILQVLADWAVVSLKTKGTNPATNTSLLVTKIEDFREGDDKILGTQDDGVFTDSTRVPSDLGLDTDSGNIMTEMLNSPQNSLQVTSNNFLIEVIGNSGRISCKVTAVFSRKDNKILYWHES